MAVTRDNLLAHDSLGNAYFDRGQLDEAVAHFREAVHIDPIDPDSRANLVRVLLEQGRIDEAMENCRERSVPGLAIRARTRASGSR